MSLENVPDSDCELSSYCHGRLVASAPRGNSKSDNSLVNVNLDQEHLTVSVMRGEGDPGERVFEGWLESASDLVERESRTP